jgi:hypothetical protein
MGKKNNVTIKKGDVIIKGDIINDTLFNDTIKYYDLNNELTGVKFFKNGKEEGRSIDFYSHDRPMIITSYSNGIKNGYNEYFDTSGKRIYRDFYYYDLIVGPIIYYDKLERPKRYFFSNLQNETLLHIDYEKWNGIKDVISDCINFTSNTIRGDTTKETNLLLYLISPPRLSFAYSIFKKKKVSDAGFIEIKQVKSDQPFIQITLPNLPQDEHYAVGLNVYDSILNKQTIVYKDL